MSSTRVDTAVDLHDLSAYCLEILSAKLTDHKARTLSSIHRLRQEYEESVLTTLTASATNIPTPSSLSVPSSSSEGSEATTPLSFGSSNTSVSLSKGDENKGALALFRPEDKYPLFVTYDIITAANEHNLRGCIGTFQAQPLETTLPEYAEIAAFDDNRFQPISRSELSNILCSVTLLTDFEACGDPFDWEVGTHGIRIKFGHHHTSTFLPSVAPEQNWTQIETLRHLVRKGGFRGPVGKARNRMEPPDRKWLHLLEQGSVVRYQGKKGSLDYASWKKWNDWVIEKQG